MTNAERAKQFMPFAALKGFEEALKEAEFVPEEKILLGKDAQEELDQILRELAIGDIVTATYYTSQQYVTLTGPVIGIDKLAQSIQIFGTHIPLVDLYNLIRTTPSKTE